MNINHISRGSGLEQDASPSVSAGKRAFAGRFVFLLFLTEVNLWQS